MAQTPISYDLGPDLERDWYVWWGDPESVYVEQEADGIHCHSGPDINDLSQGGIVWAKLEPQAPWSFTFYYTRLSDPSVAGMFDIGAFVVGGFLGTLPGYPVDPTAWSLDQLRDPARRPCAAPAMLAVVGRGGLLLFDTVAAASAQPTNDAKLFTFDQASGFRSINDPQAFSIVQNVEYKITISRVGMNVAILKEAPGHTTQTARFTDALIGLLAGGWIGLGFTNGHECRYRLVTKNAFSSSAAAGAATATPPPEKFASTYGRVPYQDEGSAPRPTRWATGVDVVDPSYDTGGSAVADWITNQAAVDIVSLELGDWTGTWRAWLDAQAVKRTEDVGPTGAGILQWAAERLIAVSLALPPWVAEAQDDPDPTANLLALVNGEYDGLHRQMAQRIARTGVRVGMLRPMWSADGSKPWSFDLLPVTGHYVDDEGVSYDPPSLWVAAFR
jgi:hypothetical protein